jgi:hypothetical protein
MMYHVPDGIFIFFLNTENRRRKPNQAIKIKIENLKSQTFALKLPKKIRQNS